MLSLTVTIPESYDESTSTIIDEVSYSLELEHSLVSLSKWESEFKTPFLNAKDKTSEESVGYIRAMNLTPNIPPEVFSRLSQQNVDAVSAYIKDPMTATTFNEPDKKTSREIITAEIIYYWMVSMNIPLECESWHLSKLLTLIKVCSLKNAPKKKMGRDEIANQKARQRALNAQRRAQMQSNG